MIHGVAEEPDFLKAPSLAPGYFHSIALTKHEVNILYLRFSKEPFNLLKILDSLNFQI